MKPRIRSYSFAFSKNLRLLTHRASESPAHTGGQVVSACVLPL